MMALEGNVMPKRRVLPAGRPWQCDCDGSAIKSIAGSEVVVWKWNPGYLNRCLDCGKERP